MTPATHVPSACTLSIQWRPSAKSVAQTRSVLAEQWCGQSRASFTAHHSQSKCTGELLHSCFSVNKLITCLHLPHDCWKSTTTVAMGWYELQDRKGQRMCRQQYANNKLVIAQYDNVCYCALQVLQSLRMCGWCCCCRCSQECIYGRFALHVQDNTVCCRVCWQSVR